MKIPILTFHAWRKGTGFAENDHTASDEVLHTLTAQKIAVVPLHRAVAALSNPFVRWRLPTRAVALTCDDGDVSEVESSVSDTGEKSLPSPKFWRVMPPGNGLLAGIRILLALLLQMPSLGVKSNQMDRLLANGGSRAWQMEDTPLKTTAGITAMMQSPLSRSIASKKAPSLAWTITPMPAAKFATRR